MCNIEQEQGAQTEDKGQILSACNDYNLILQNKKEASMPEKWKLIFHTDQSLL